MGPDDVEPALEAVAAHDEALVGPARAAFAAALAEDGPPRMLVAEREGRLVGVMGYGPDPWGVADVWWAEWLFVRPEARRQGVAAALYAEVERLLLERACRKVYLDVGNEDEHGAAIAFHRSRGFAQEGSLRDFWADGEDFLVFAKRLRSAQSGDGPS